VLRNIQKKKKDTRGERYGLLSASESSNKPTLRVADGYRTPIELAR